MAKTSHTGVLPLVLSVLARDTSQLGMTFAQVREATGLSQRQASSALHLLRQAGKCCSTGVHRDDRFYYANEGRLADCREAVEARLVEVRKQRKAVDSERRRAANARYYARLGKSEPTPRAPKVAAPKPAKAKPSVLPAPVTVRTKPAQRWSDAEPVNPNGVKPTVCPGYVPRTFAPPPFFRGEYTNEWQQLRGARE